MPRALRADAQENLDKILQAAAAAFADPAAETSMVAIAAKAGVGVGTMYRRFATREDLIEAIYRTETADLCDRAGVLAEALPPAEALETWLHEFVSYILLKDGMAEALPLLLDTKQGLRADSRVRLEDAVETLLSEGRRAEVFRDVPAWDVLMSAGGITLITKNERQPELATRLIQILIAGVRETGGPPR